MTKKEKWEIARQPQDTGLKTKNWKSREPRVKKWRFFYHSISNLYVDLNFYWRQHETECVIAVPSSQYLFIYVFNRKPTQTESLKRNCNWCNAISIRSWKSMSSHQRVQICRNWKVSFIFEGDSLINQSVTNTNSSVGGEEIMQRRSLWNLALRYTSLHL